MGEGVHAILSDARRVRGPRPRAHHHVGAMAPNPTYHPAPRDSRAEALLVRWDQVMTLPIILAAVAPLVLAPSEEQSLIVAVVAIASWLVFVADLLVRTWCLPGYLRTGPGWFDLFIVVFTFPFAVFGIGNARFAGVFRILRLVRLLAVGKRARHFLQTMNRVVIVATAVLCLSSYIVMRAEGPSTGFDNYGDALWWGIVTLTTVGYGDLVPETSTGQITAAILMITGVALLGTLAGTLASALRLDLDDGEADPDHGDGATGGPIGPGQDPSQDPGEDQDLTAQLARIEAQLAALHERLDQATGSG